MAKFYLLLRSSLLLVMMAVGVSAFAQEKVVTGKVTSKDDGTPIPGVNVLVKGTTNGSSTDADGVFNVTVGNDATLLFSFIGYKTQEVLVGNQTNINVVLEADITALAEVVVVGYGSQEKKNVTGSIAAVGSKDFNKGVMASPQDLLQGKVAGVQITSADGSPGGNQTIRIRGSNSLSSSLDPLIVIDGVPIDNSVPANGGTSLTPGLSNPLTLINPNDIETMTVLKDASATAIYGLRAGNGVIIITTKKGSQGKPQFFLNSTVSVSTPQRYLSVLNGDQMRTLVNQQIADGLPGITSAALVRLGTANTDWQKQIYHNSVSTDHNLGVSGAYKGMPYRVSYGFTDQNGLLKNTGFLRNSINLNLTPSFLDGDLQVQATFKGSYIQQNFGNTGAVGAAAAFDPTQPVMNGSPYGGYTEWTTLATANPNGSNNPSGTVNAIATHNPVALANLADNKSNVYRGIGNLKLDYRLPFLPALKLTVSGGFDASKSLGHNNLPNDAASTAASGFGLNTIYTGRNVSKLLDIYANYSRSFGKSNLDVTAGHSYQNFAINSTNFAYNGATPRVYSDFITTTAPDGSTVYLPHPAVPQYNDLESYFARVNYSFADKYLFSASARNDASSRWSKQNRNDIFWGASVGWKINQEGFMKGISQISDLKLRASYGNTGNQNVNISGGSQNSSYPYLGLYQQGTAPYQYQFGNGTTQPFNYVATQRPQAYNANLKWESTAQADIGLDFGLWANRLTGTIDVYQKKTSNLLNQIPAAIGTNFSNSLLANVGSLTNKGVELSLRSDIIKTENFGWNFGVNISHNANKVTKLLINPDPTSYGNLYGPGIGGGLGGQILNQQVGFPLNSYFVYQQIYNAQGKPVEGLYKDVSGDGGTITASYYNRIRDHSPNPAATLGLTSRFNYKKFDLFFSGHAVFGNWVYNNTQSANAYLGNVYWQTGYFNNLPSDVLNTNFRSLQSLSSYYVQNATFFRMDNISLGYNISDIGQKLKARVSLTCQNAFFITKYKGVDPEVSGGIDNNIYPRPRIYMVGLNLSF